MSAPIPTKRAPGEWTLPGYVAVYDEHARAYAVYAIDDDGIRPGGPITWVRRLNGRDSFRAFAARPDLAVNHARA